VTIRYLGLSRIIWFDYVKKHAKEARNFGVNMNEAWDNVEYINFRLMDDFIPEVFGY
jgi:hypothetical protein